MVDPEWFSALPCCPSFFTHLVRNQRNRPFFLLARALFACFCLAIGVFPGSPFIGSLQTSPSLEMVHLHAGVLFISQVISTSAGPTLVSTMQVDLTMPGVSMEVVQAHNQLISPDERLSSMANRTGALAGINGDFFEVGGLGRPIGLDIINGQLWQSPTWYASFGITSFQQFTINHESFSASITDGEASYRLTSVNHFGELSQGGLGMVTPAAGASINVAGDSLAFLQPVQGQPDKFTVLSLQASGTTLPALSGQEVLVGRGASGAWILAHLHPGDAVSLCEQIFPDTNLFEGIGGGPIVVWDGRPYIDSNTPEPGAFSRAEPVTAVGVSRDGQHALFVIFDGRNSGPLRSKGVTGEEVAQFLIARGAYQAMTFDGGGSSEMVARLPGDRNVSVVNYPSEGIERPVANGLFVYA